MPLFGKSQKTPAELVKALKEAVNSLERGDKKAEKAQEDVSKNLVSRSPRDLLHSPSSMASYLYRPVPYRPGKWQRRREEKLGAVIQRATKRLP